ncbi:MAG TPA: hypothetical protein VI589_16275, partial [Vicinamibacteria bacterium]
MRSLPLVSLLCVAVVVNPGCGEGEGPMGMPPPSPTPPAATDVVVGPRSGPTQITFVAAEPPPGTVIAGCGADASGCSGRVRMRFRLLSVSGGPVLDAIGFLHATNKLACYGGSTGLLDLQPGVPREIVIVFDRPDAAACGIP